MFALFYFLCTVLFYLPLYFLICVLSISLRVLMWWFFTLFTLFRFVLCVSHYTFSQLTGAKDKGEEKKSEPDKAQIEGRYKPTREPLFSTNLRAPIEDVIKEAANDVTKSSDSEKPVNKPKKKKSTSRKPNQKPEEISSDSTPSDQESFLTVRRKKSPKSKTNILPSTTTVNVSPKKVKEDVVVIEKTDKGLVEQRPKDIVSKEAAKSRESKKVHAKISYASVASQRFEESLEQLRKEEEKQLKEKQEKGTATKLDEATPLKSEELIDEIQSEKQRLVDLVEEDPTPTKVRTSEETENIESQQIHEIESEEERLVELIAEDPKPKQVEFSEKSTLQLGDIESEEQRIVDLIEKDPKPTRFQTSEETEYIESQQTHEIESEEQRLIDLVAEDPKPKQAQFSEENASIETLQLDEIESEEQRLVDLIEEDPNPKHIEIIEETECIESQQLDEVESQEQKIVALIEEDPKPTQVTTSEESEYKESQKIDEIKSVEQLVAEDTKLKQLIQSTEEVASYQINGNLSKPASYNFLKEEIANNIRQQLEITTNGFASETLEEENPTSLENNSNIQLEVTKPFKMSSGLQIRILTLNDKEHQDSTIYRLEKHWILQFRLGPSLLGRKVSLYCNYPKENQDFQRHSYQLLEWQQDEGCTYSDDTALLTELTVKISGSFHYYFTYEDGNKDEHQGSGFFLVDPTLKYGKNEESLPLDCIQCQTVLAKSLGPFNTWENKLRVSKESGYNMIHFTPIQELGVSNSSYSLRNQLKVNPIFGSDVNFEDIKTLTEKMRTEWKMTSICDIVLNHTANESDWLKEHPEATYNCQNCPYMRPAYLLDAALHQFSLDVAKGRLEDKGIPVVISNEDHLNAIRYYLHSDVLYNLKLQEFYICDVNKLVALFLELCRSDVNEEKACESQLKIVQDPEYRRLASTVDMKLATKLYNVYRRDCFDEETRIKRCVEEFKNKLDSLNGELIDRLSDHLNAAVENVIAGIRYYRVQHDGPKVREITEKNPLVFRYFTDFGKPASVAEHEEVMLQDGRFLMAHNGWVMNSDPLRNFAAPDSNVYLRRELIAWGDSVKLRYGEKPEDCPYLWQHMREYVETTVRIFDGVRLDNCHSTPIVLAEYLLDCARKIRPDLYIVAELFTNSDQTDNIFVNRLGITSLIREAMSAWDSHEQGRLVYRYGGSPVGSFYQPRIRPLLPTVAHAIFLDLTHDNPSPIEKRSVFDFLPSTALVNMACCASGSNRGYDELVPHHIHVVDEIREYAEWSEENISGKFVGKSVGIIAAKKALNELHFLLGKEGFSQVYVDQIDSDIVAVTRHCPDTHQSYVLVAFTAFTHPPQEAADQQRYIKPLRVEGILDEIVLEASLTKSGSRYAKLEEFEKDPHYINGLPEYYVDISEHIQATESKVFEKVDSGADNTVQLNFKNFKPGSVVVIKVSLPEDMNAAIKNVRNLIQKFSTKKDHELWNIISGLTLADLNRAIYRCDQEERDEGHGFDTYDIPNFGRLVYAGFQGFMSLLATIRPNNDLGHPMCANLRDGNWMIDYIWQRLKLDEGTRCLGQWFEENSKSLKALPRYLIPCYFDVIVTGIYILLHEQSYNLMSTFVKKGSTFVKGLAMGSIQFGAYIKSADLPVLSPNLKEPRPLQRNDDKQACVTLSAGLPHFSVGYMRNWGRDTFIALRGLFLLTGRYQDARYHILGYAACLRHGLIPNLLDGGRNPRFNCRDAIWWWLYCIKSYTEEAPSGLDILTDVVSRIFPDDSSPNQVAGACDQPLYDVMQEALKTHFQGLLFRERNAGPQIDAHMCDEGFNNQIGVNPETGFVFGGNAHNCGTWMDKMGSSQKAGTRGKPATPRDGSAVELIGLLKAVLSWLDQLHANGAYPYDSVERVGKTGIVTKWSFKQWAEKVQNNFEKCFWIGSQPDEQQPRPDLVNKTEIYKDCYGASQEWTDYQLRCNFPIAMVVAPELFNAKNAWLALKQTEKYLLGPLGMKTLDPDDWAYNGYYDNSNDSDNPNVAHGFNYHQGPEWVWPVGFYLRAKLHFAAANGELEKTVAETKLVLSRHFVELQTSTWRGLPELTNKDGAFCNDSSRTQAWSMSCILEVLHDLQRLEKSLPTIN